MAKNRTQRCPHCGQEIEVHRDGSFTMHGKQDGSLCRGTNCTTMDSGTLVLGGKSFLVKDITLDPDGDMDARDFKSPRGHRT